jgi:hypothetical protein
MSEKVAHSERALGQKKNRVGYYDAALRAGVEGKRDIRSLGFAGILVAHGYCNSLYGLLRYANNLAGESNKPWV